MRLTPNHRVNPPGGPVTSLARAARPAPVPPAGYTERDVHRGEVDGVGAAMVGVGKKYG